MSRSGYSDECGGLGLIRWRGAVTSAIRGNRGQAMLRELLAALDAMPVKRLIAEELERNGEYCALGVLGKTRGIALAEIDPYDQREIAQKFGIAKAMASEIAFINDGTWRSKHTTPEERWAEVREWVAKQIKEQS